jgi:predicted transcriptional regulator of viral defense system
VPSDVTQVDSLPVTTVARTIKDCMTTGTDPHQLRLAIDQAERDGTLRRTVAAELRAELDTAGAHWPGQASVNAASDG